MTPSFINVYKELRIELLSYPIVGSGDVPPREGIREKGHKIDAKLCDSGEVVVRSSLSISLGYIHVVVLLLYN